MTRKVLLKTFSDQVHSSVRLMKNNPPQGWEFVHFPQKKTVLFKNKRVNKFFIKFLSFKSHFFGEGDIKIREIPSEIDLIFSEGLALGIDFPHVVEILDHPACLAGYNYALFIKKRKQIEKKLASPFCKKIIVVNESSLALMRKYFNKKVLDKACLIRAGVEKKDFKKSFRKKYVQLLFMGSLANPEDFYIKGGLEAIESFIHASRKNKRISLIVRCKVPEDVKQKYKKVPRLKIIEDPLEFKEWANLFVDADIALQPGHIYPLMAILDFLSYGVPIIMLDTYSVRDYLNEDNSILVKHSEKIFGYRLKQYPLNVRSKKFISQIKKVDRKVIRSLSGAIAKLEENASLRRRLGKNGKQTITDKFSLEERNRQLKKVFDEASTI